MKKKICLQSGHKGVTSGATGTAGEQELNWRITLRLSEILQQKGFALYIVDANPPQEQLNQDFDFFLAIHGDWNSPLNGGGCISEPDPNYDDNNAESKRIVDIIRNYYFVPYTNDTGIRDVPGKVSVNMTKYYMWNRLSLKTPCGLIELGEVMDAHDRVILADTDRVCNAIAKGICEALDVPWEEPKPPEPPTDPCKLYKDHNKELAKINEELMTTMKHQEEAIDELGEDMEVLSNANKQLRLELRACEKHVCPKPLCPETDNCPGWMKRLIKHFCK